MSYKTPTKAVITDAGFASRFLPITKTIPKAIPDKMGFPLKSPPMFSDRSRRMCPDIHKAHAAGRR